MPKVRTYSLDTLQKIRKELKKQEQPKRTRELSTRAAILELKTLLDEKLAAGWTYADLAESLSESGLPIAPKTLKEYLEIGPESSPESGGEKTPQEASMAVEPAPQAAETAVAKTSTEEAPSGFVVMKDEEL